MSAVAPSSSLSRAAALATRRAKHAQYGDSDDEANFVRIPRHKPVRDYVAQQVAEAIEKRLGK